MLRGEPAPYDTKADRTRMELPFPRKMSWSSGPTIQQANVPAVAAMALVRCGPTTTFAVAIASTLSSELDAAGVPQQAVGHQ
jgi:hypothetical protein